MTHGRVDKALIEKINELSPERISEVEDFVDFILLRDADRMLTGASAAASLPVFGAVWSNPADDVYDTI